MQAFDEEILSSPALLILKQLPNFKQDNLDNLTFFITLRTNLIFLKLESYSTRSSHIYLVLGSFKVLKIGQKKT